LFYTLADLNQGLIERKEVPTFIKANVKTGSRRRKRR